MKKILLAFFAITLFYNTNYAQSKYNLGLVLGPNYTSLRGSDFLQGTKPGFGYLVGVSIEYVINKTFSISSGCNFEQKVIKNESDFGFNYFDETTGMIVLNNINESTNNKYQYLSFPLFFKYSMGKNKSFYLNGGPFISFLQTHKKESKFVNKSGEAIIYSSAWKYNFPLADEISGDYGISLAIGKTFEIDMKNKVSIELRYNLGLKNTIEDIQIYGESGVIKTNSLNLIANWSFNL
jgi:hypothetical protein